MLLASSPGPAGPSPERLAQHPLSDLSSSPGQRMAFVVGSHRQAAPAANGGSCQGGARESGSCSHPRGLSKPPRRQRRDHQQAKTVLNAMPLGSRQSSQSTSRRSCSTSFHVAVAEQRQLPSMDSPTCGSDTGKQASRQQRSSYSGAAASFAGHRSCRAPLVVSSAKHGGHQHPGEAAAFGMDTRSQQTQHQSLLHAQSA